MATNQLENVTNVLTSLQIAEITGKSHYHIIRDIRMLLEQGVSETNFGLCSYIDKTNRERPCYNLTKKGCLILASGYDALLRERIINRWEELEHIHAVPTSFKEALLLAAKQQEEIEEQQKRILVLTPKAEYTEKVLQSDNTYTLTQIAHDCGLRSVHVLTSMLKKNGILYRQSNQWQPTAKVADKGYFATRTAVFTKKDDTQGTNITTVVTESGRNYIHNFIANI